jgi:hypothetical protein
MVRMKEGRATWKQTPMCWQSKLYGVFRQLHCRTPGRTCRSATYPGPVSFLMTVSAIVLAVRGRFDLGRPLGANYAVLEVEKTTVGEEMLGRAEESGGEL